MVEEDRYPVKRLRRPPPRHVRFLVPAVVLFGLLAIGTGSFVVAVAMVAVLGGLAVGLVLAARSAGFDSSSPLIQRLRARPWRDPEVTLRAALRHLPSVFVSGLRGQVFAPSRVEVVLSPRYFAELCEAMDETLIARFAEEEYLSVMKTYGAQIRHEGPGAPQAWHVLVKGSAQVADGAFAICRRPVAFGPVAGPAAGSAAAQTPHMIAKVREAPHPARHSADSHDGMTIKDATPTLLEDVRTVLEDSQPQAHKKVDFSQLGLETKGAWRWTGASPAIAGRDPHCAVPLPLPMPDTVSRHHAEFSRENGAWWVAPLGRNGLLVNGRPATVKTRLDDEDRISWGSKTTSPSSIVRIRNS